jgi:hypothetical protein
MLAAAKMVGFLLTQDYDKARAFFEGKLGFQFVSLDQFALVMSVGGHNIRISKVPNFTPFQSTVLGRGAALLRPNHPDVSYLAKPGVYSRKL